MWLQLPHVSGLPPGIVQPLLQPGFIAKITRNDSSAAYESAMGGTQAVAMPLVCRRGGLRHWSSAVVGWPLHRPRTVNGVVTFTIATEPDCVLPLDAREYNESASLMGRLRIRPVPKTPCSDPALQRRGRLA